MSTEDVSTPRPWHLGPHYKHDIESQHGNVGTTHATPRGWADAGIIVQAVNAHDALVAALKAYAHVDAMAAYLDAEGIRRLEDAQLALALAKETP